MTLIEFAASFGTGLNIKYCDLTLVTGANDGSDWANAWQTPAAVTAGEAAGDCVAFKSRSVVVTGAATLWAVMDAIGTAAQPCVWVAVDDSDNVVDETNWEQRGGTVGVNVDMTATTGDSRGLNPGTGKVHRYFYGFFIDGANYGTVTLAPYNRYPFCKTKSSRTAGFFTNQIGGSYSDCIMELDAIGLSAGGNILVECKNLIFDRCATGTNNPFGPFYNCIFTGNTVGRSAVSSQGSWDFNCLYINNTTAINFAATANRRIFSKNCLFVGNTTAISMGAVTQNAIMLNCGFFINGTKFGGVGAANTIEDGSFDLSETPFVDSGLGNYTNKSTIARLKNYESVINALTTSYLQAGLGQLISAGGGGGYRTRARTIGI